MRALAISVVVLLHIIVLVPYLSSSVGNVLLRFDRLIFGLISFVFALSGYCLFLPLVGDRTNVVRTLDLKRYARRRVARIYPAYLGGLAICIFLLFLGQNLAFEKTSETIFPWTNQSWAVLCAHLLLVQTFFDKCNCINVTYWAVSTECQFYLLFPILMYLTKRTSLRITLSVPIVVTIIFRLVIRCMFPSAAWDRSPVDQFCLGQWATFGCGMIAAAVVSRKVSFGRFDLQSSQSTTLLLALFLSACAAVGHPWILSPVIWSMAAGVWLIYLHTFEGRLKNAISMLAPLGRVSFSWYIIHFPVLVVLLAACTHYQVGPTAESVIMLTLGLPLSIAAAYPFFFLFEWPFLKSTYARLNAATPRLVGEPA